MASLVRYGSSIESRLSSSIYSSHKRGSRRPSLACVENRTGLTQGWIDKFPSDLQSLHGWFARRYISNLRPRGTESTDAPLSRPHGSFKSHTVSNSATFSAPLSTSIHGNSHTIVTGSGSPGELTRKKTKKRQKSPPKDYPGQSFQDIVQEALIQGDYGGLMKVLLATSNNSEFIKSIPENTFNEVLSLAKPSNFLDWIESPYSHISPVVARRLRIPPAYDLVMSHFCRVLEVLASRQEAGKPLNVSDYCLILGMARWAGLGHIARSFWRSMQVDQVMPDLGCYNNYLGALVSNLHFRGEVQHKYRVTSFNSEARLQRRLGQQFAAYRFGDNGIKEELMSIHREMVKARVTADEETYRILILGLAREGDLDSVKGILQQIWDVNVDALMDGQDDEYSTPQFQLDSTSPKFPTLPLLHTVAHAFGINNDIPTALRIVDHISRKYDLQIQHEVWRELFNWTFVVSVSRQQSRGGRALLPKNSVQKLWETMRGEPYNMQPSLEMYDKLIKSLFLQQRTRDMWHYMNEALPFYLKTRLEVAESYKLLRNSIKKSNRDYRTAQTTAEHGREYTRKYLLQICARLRVKRWVRLLLGSMRTWRRVDRDLVWSTVRIPRFVQDWREYMPREVTYFIPGGRVSISVHTAQDMLDRQLRGYAKLQERDRDLSKKHHTLLSIARFRTKRMKQARRQARQHDVLDRPQR